VNICLLTPAVIGAVGDGLNPPARRPTARATPEAGPGRATRPSAGMRRDARAQHQDLGARLEYIDGSLRGVLHGPLGER
jgi:hypothetical protein